MDDSLLVFTLNSTSPDWCVGMFSNCLNTAIQLSRNVCTSAALHCIEQNVHSPSFTITDTFSRRYVPKMIFTFLPQVALFFDLFISKFICQLLLLWVTSPLSLNAVQCTVYGFVFELLVGMGQTDGRKDRRMDR